MQTKLAVIKGDITRMQVDAIVNAANTSLLGGGGVDGAIHRAGGPSILQQCIEIRQARGGCPAGEAVITTAGDLQAKYIIHTVGPIWNGGGGEERQLLANCYRNSLLLAVGNSVKSIAFPNISTGVYHFPKKLAADIALKEVQNFILLDQTIESIFFVCFDDENFLIYQERLRDDRNT